jgi:hypothetical protein
MFDGDDDRDIYETRCVYARYVYARYLYARYVYAMYVHARYMYARYVYALSPLVHMMCKCHLVLCFFACLTVTTTETEMK